jgi:uncharacterized protein YqiB (DUF1249 family)|tara:strand:+ start:232 stop:711 length:480 start_codon:yes stop_codon:yes gene_type:complete
MLCTNITGESIIPSQRQSKTRYKVNLVELQAKCATNYGLMLRIFPALSHDGVFEFALSNCGTVRMNLIERTPYTDLVGLQQSGVASILPNLSLCKIRMYHDARMAEVVEWEGQRGLKGRYEYPNEAMHQEDEKWQRNKFLGELLSYCLREGRALITPEF